MALGFVTFEGMGYRDPIYAAAEYGFDFLELQFSYSAVDSELLGREYITEHADDINAALDETGLDLVMHLPHTMDIGATSPYMRDGSIEETKACLRAAENVNAQKCVIHPTSSARLRVWDVEQIQSYILDSIRELHPYAQDRGIDLCMENLYHGPFTIQRFDRFLAETDCPMTLDTGHARIAGYDEDDIAEFLEAHGDRVSHIHANDNKEYITGLDDSINDDHVPTGVGDLDFGTALAPTQNSGWDGTISLEIHTRDLAYIELAKDRFETMLH